MSPAWLKYRLPPYCLGSTPDLSSLSSLRGEDSGEGLQRTLWLGLRPAVQACMAFSAAHAAAFTKTIPRPKHCSPLVGLAPLAARVIQHRGGGHLEDQVLAHDAGLAGEIRWKGSRSGRTKQRRAERSRRPAPHEQLGVQADPLQTIATYRGNPGDDDEGRATFKA